MQLLFGEHSFESEKCKTCANVVRLVSYQMYDVDVAAVVVVVSGTFVAVIQISVMRIAMEKLRMAA